MSESDEQHEEQADAPEEETTGERDKGKINDPLTSKDVESPRMSWQPQRPSPQDSEEDDG